MGLVEVLFAEFTGDQGVAPFRPEMVQGAATASAEDGDATGARGAELDPREGLRIALLQAAFQGRPRDALAQARDGQPFVVDEPIHDLETEVRRDERVVADHGVGIQR